MSLSADDFYSSFSDKELKEIKLKTWRGKGDGVIFIRSLPRSEVVRFKSLSAKIAQKRALSVLSGVDSEKEYEDDLSRAEDYLIKQSVCDNTGKRIFDTDEDIKKFNELISPEIANEIIAHIELNNQLYNDFEGRKELIDSYKKK